MISARPFCANANGELEARYVATDVGATLGKVGGLGGKRSKNSLEDFRSSKFILGVQNGMVKFEYDTTPKKTGPTLTTHV